MVNYLNDIRNYVHMHMKSKQYESAVYYSEILNTGSQNLSDMLLLTEAMFNNNEYRRVIHFINKNASIKKYLTFRYIEASSHFALNDGITAIQVLDHNLNVTKNIMNSSLYGYAEDSIGFQGYDELESSFFGNTYKQLENKCYMLLAEIYSKIENRDMATEYYKLAVRSDVSCYSAMKKLQLENMLSPSEAQLFISSLDFSEIPNEKLSQIIKASYEDLFNTECNVGNELKCLQSDYTLVNHHSSLLNCATRYYNNSRFKKAYELTKRILKEDPHNPNVITLHVAILVELKFNNELYSFSSSLIDNYPDKKESWYAIGCYSLTIDNYDLAIQQLMKATEIDKFFGYAWLAIGHAYSTQKKSDQARAAYCTASQSIKGSHVPLVYIALEYSQDNNLNLSLRYLQEAIKTGSHDPYFWNEKGYLAFNCKNYSDSLKFFLNAYELKRNEINSLTEFWAPLFSNIGHCYMKLGDFDKSLEYFEKALGKKPNNPSIMNSLALVYVRKGSASEAQNYLRRVLGIDHSNLFAQSLLISLRKLNAKYSMKIIPENNFELSDTFKIFDVPLEKKQNSNDFESLRKILNKDACKILSKVKPKE